jgi:hypothetical protein
MLQNWQNGPETRKEARRNCFQFQKLSKDIVYNHIATVRVEANHDRLNATAYFHKVQPQQQQPQGSQQQ